MKLSTTLPQPLRGLAKTRYPFFLFFPSSFFFFFTLALVVPYLTSSPLRPDLMSITTGHYVGLLNLTCPRYYQGNVLEAFLLQNLQPLARYYQAGLLTCLSGIMPLTKSCLPTVRGFIGWLPAIPLLGRWVSSSTNFGAATSTGIVDFVSCFPYLVSLPSQSIKYGTTKANVVFYLLFLSFLVPGSRPSPGQLSVIS